MFSKKQLSKNAENHIVVGIERGNRIQSYWHCKRCMTENLYPNIGGGFTDVGIQVWCENHNTNIRHLDLCGNKVKEAA